MRLFAVECSLVWRGAQSSVHLFAFVVSIPTRQRVGTEKAPQQCALSGRTRKVPWQRQVRSLWCTLKGDILKQTTNSNHKPTLKHSHRQQWNQAGSHHWDQRGEEGHISGCSGRVAHGGDAGGEHCPVQQPSADGRERIRRRGWHGIRAYDSLVMVDRRHVSAPPTDPLLVEAAAVYRQADRIRMRTGSHRGGDHGFLPRTRCCAANCRCDYDVISMLLDGGHLIRLC
jgi:hypothetical protein